MAEFNLEKDFDGVAFDFDGVLADSNNVHTDCRIRTYSELAVELGDDRYALIPYSVHESAHLESQGSHSAAINAWLLAKYGIIEDPEDITHPAVHQVVARITKHYQTEVRPGLEEMPGAIDLVKGAHGQMQDKLGIGTMSHMKEVMPFLRRHDLGKYFNRSHIITFDDSRVVEKKPAPDVYLALSKTLQVHNPERLLVIEDSQPGVAAAKNMGATVIAVANTRSEEALRGVEPGVRPDAVVADNYAVAELIGVAATA